MNHANDASNRHKIPIAVPQSEFTLDRPRFETEMFVWDLGSLSPNLNFTDLPLTVAFASAGFRVRLSVGINGDLPHFLHSPPQGNLRVMGCVCILAIVTHATRFPDFTPMARRIRVARASHCCTRVVLLFHISSRAAD